ncbi:phytoene/squalene synthase family protein [Flavihumibacter sp. UBA7668]|uniref:phytoene/squalene synthase family protein n=1 Tax=Flavihumibacter sp. UBA7668 TaxID=1946542 RepID=UPI0025C552C9|nr:phytoene/squalene synthase family protein [Flavihumibacter sp. UBA7668]
MMQLFHTVCELTSKITTERYSTSFSSAIKLLHHDLRQPIFNIYGFVRFADEIVDTFHAYDKETLIKEFREQTYQAIDRKISLNPILHSFQLTVNQYNIDHELIEAFFRSMEMDLNQKAYDHQGYMDYIYGSAEVVGLMCLYVFCEGDRSLYQRLKDQARSLGAAFQKVNFLRDLKADYNCLERVYFPGCDFSNFTACDKSKIEADIQHDFDEAYKGIMKLPVKARFGVYVAYKYYLSLFNRIKRVQPQRILVERIRIPNYRKAAIVVRAGVKNQLGMIG